MRIRFYLLLLLCVAMATLWMQVHLGVERVTQVRLKKLSTYPIYVFVEDTSLIPETQNELTPVASIASIQVKDGRQEAFRVAVENNLGVGEAQLERYRFPTVVEITFFPIYRSIGDRDKTLKVLHKHFYEDEIMAHQEIADELISEISVLRRARLYINIFMLLICLLITLWGKLNLELRLLLTQKINPYSIVDKIRYKSRLKNQAFGLAVFPALISFTIYMGLSLKDMIDPLIQPEFFGIQALAFLSASLLAYLIVRSKAYQAVNEPEIKMAAPPNPESILPPVVAEPVVEQTEETKDESQYS